MKSAKKILIFFVLSALILPAYTLISPETYKKQIQLSQIKTQAVVKKVKTIDNRNGLREKLVMFESLENNTPKEFSATCYYFKKTFPWQQDLIGGIYYNPKKGDKVYVTVIRNGGDITSYTLLTPELKEALLKTPDKVELIWGKAFVKE